MEGWFRKEKLLYFYYTISINNHIKIRTKTEKIDRPKTELHNDSSQ
jgi:hypothetical protein